MFLPVSTLPEQNIYVKKKITEWVGGDDTCALLCHDIDLFI